MRVKLVIHDTNIKVNVKKVKVRESEKSTPNRTDSNKKELLNVQWAGTNTVIVQIQMQKHFFIKTPIDNNISENCIRNFN